LRNNRDMDSATVAPNASPATRIVSQAELTNVILPEMVVCYDCYLEAGQTWARYGSG